MNESNVPPTLLPRICSDRIAFQYFKETPTIDKIVVEAALDKWRQLMSVMSLSGGKN